jgi:hypothetical protein
MGDLGSAPLPDCRTVAPERPERGAPCLGSPAPRSLGDMHLVAIGVGTACPLA